VATLQTRHFPLKEHGARNMFFFYNQRIILWAAAMSGATNNTSKVPYTSTIESLMRVIVRTRAGTTPIAKVVSGYKSYPCK